MGSNISIGVVYSNESKIINELNNVLKFLKNRNSQVNKIKYCKDEDGEDWIEDVSINNNVLKLSIENLVKNHLGSIELNGLLFNNKKINLIIRIEKGDREFGLLFDFNFEDLIVYNTLDELELLSAQMISFMKDLFVESRYEYSFCDHEAEIDFMITKNEIVNSQIYSIVLLPTNSGKDEIKIYESTWHIDGLTNRI